MRTWTEIIDPHRQMDYVHRKEAAGWSVKQVCYIGRDKVLVVFERTQTHNPTPEETS